MTNDFDEAAVVAELSALSNKVRLRRRLEERGHQLCWWLAAKRFNHGQPWGWMETAWTAIWWRYYCPRPIIDDWTARACAEGGHCGCSSGDRFRTNQ